MGHDPALLFSDHPRFRALGTLGHGSMGVVYRVFDREMEQEVALKALRDPEPEGVAELKQEFRVVADLAHENLVELYGLFFEGEHCFFTMELLDGVDFLHHVWGSDGLAAQGGLSEAGVQRLAHAVAQLVSGLSAIHAAGTLHRDIKPSNVMICGSEGGSARVVLLDFGLVAPLAARPAEAMTGTIAYMAPEQAWGKSIDDTADWYALGVLLYEAVTGHLPFSDDFAQMLREKEQGSFVPLDIYAPTTPAWLARLVADLLHPDPAQRPRGAEIIERYPPGLQRLVDPDRAETSLPARVVGEWGGERSPFVGREKELARLAAVYDALREGPLAVVRVHGPSGIGKTEFLRRFLDGIEPSAVALRGRCHPQESLPFNALDHVVDELASFLEKGDVSLDELPPEELAALGRLFPALRRLRAVESAADADLPLDPRLVRRWGAAAFRRLLRRIGQRSRLVIWIDDLQWGDEDSVALLHDLLRATLPPRLLLLLSYRSEDRSTNTLLQDLEALTASLSEALSFELALGPLAREEGCALSAALLDRLGVAETGESAAIAEEAGGSPFFIGEMARYLAKLRARGRDAGMGLGTQLPLRVANIVSDRFDDLAPIERRVLEIVCIAAAPIARDVVLEAAELRARSRAILAALEHRCLLRSTAAAGRPAVQPYHDRIGEAMVERLSAEARRLCHAALARALRFDPDADPQALITHCLGAQEYAEAGRHAIHAAEQAAAKLAFRRAAEFYELALDHCDPEVDRHPLLVRLAEALVNAGRGRDAARWFQVAADELARRRPDSLGVLTLRRRAAEQLLHSGNFEEGISLMESVSHKLGLRFPRSSAAAVRSFLWHRTRVLARGLSFDERRNAFTSDALERMDVIFGTAKGLSMVNPTLAAALHGQHLIQALELGEPSRVSQALTNEAAWSAIIGGRRMWRRAQRVLETTQRLVAQTGDPYDEAFYRMGAGAVAWSSGEWAASAAHCERAVDIYRSDCQGVAFEIALTNVFLLSALALCGRVAELVQRAEEERHDARERGDLFALSACTLHEGVVAWLARDQPALAIQQADQVIGGWSTEIFLTQHYHHLNATVVAHLYAGDAWAAWGRLERAWPRLSSARFLSLECPRTLLYALRGGTALAASTTPGARPAELEKWSPRRLRREASRCARRLAHRPLPFSKALAAQLDGTRAALDGDVEGAARQLRSAIEGFASAGMGLHEQAARARLGGLLGGSEGDALVEESRSQLLVLGVARPSALWAALAPGFPEPRAVCRNDAPGRGAEADGER